MRGLAILAVMAGPVFAQAIPVPQAVPQDQIWPQQIRLALGECWNVGALTSDAMRATATLRVTFDPTGRPEASSISLSSFTGEVEAAEQLFGSARRAILRCGRDGFDLPADRYALWKVMELTFDPAELALR